MINTKGTRKREREKKYSGSFIVEDEKMNEKTFERSRYICNIITKV